MLERLHAWVLARTALALHARMWPGSLAWSPVPFDRAHVHTSTFASLPDPICRTSGYPAGQRNSARQDNRLRVR